MACLGYWNKWPIRFMDLGSPMVERLHWPQILALAFGPYGTKLIIRGFDSLCQRSCLGGAPFAEKPQHWEQFSHRIEF